MRWSVRKRVHIIVSFYLTASLQQLLMECVYTCICIQMGQLDAEFVQGFVVTWLRS